MVSIITAVHNQLAVNRLFVESLAANSQLPYELIIIDNASTDGSAEFFESVGATVIRNPANYCYPVCQNQGMALAKYDWFAFLNNDIIVPPGWDARFTQSMQAHALEVATSCGIERVETPERTSALKRRWKRIKNPLSLFGINRFTLKLMHRLMYGDWAAFSGQRSLEFKQAVVEGFVGNSVFMRRSAFEKVGPWDERVQAGDYDLFLRTRARAASFGDIKPMHICLDVFVHHYIRLTLKAKPPKFVGADTMIDIPAKWSSADIDYLERNKSLSY